MKTLLQLAHEYRIGQEIKRLDLEALAVSRGVGLCPEKAENIEEEAFMEGYLVGQGDLIKRLENHLKTMRIGSK